MTARVLIVNRFSGSDAVPTARMLGDVELALRLRGAEVEVLSGEGSYLPSVVARRRPPPGRIRNGYGRVTQWIRFWWQFLREASGGSYSHCLMLTDPPFLPWIWHLSSRFRSRGRGFWWTMDLYPEAFIAAGMMREGSVQARFFRRLNEVGLRSLAGVVALGRCQVERLTEYSSWHEAKISLLIEPPWDVRESVIQPPGDVVTAVRDLGWEGRKVALYAGNLGRAHIFRPFLAAARELHERGDASWLFAFFVRGEGRSALSAEADELSNVVVSDYVAPERTKQLLWSATVHLVSMDDGWDGIVIPSKVYGTTWTGRPILFLGPMSSSTAKDLAEFDLGLTLTTDSGAPAVIGALERLSERPRRVSEALASRQRTAAGRVADFILGQPDD